MQFSTKTTAPEKTRTGCAIIPVLGGKPAASGTAIDAASGGALSAAIARGDLAAKAGSTLLIGMVRRTDARRVAVGHQTLLSRGTLRTVPHHDRHP